MESHIKVVAWLHIALHSLGLVAALIIWGILMMVGVATTASPEGGLQGLFIVGGIGSAIALFLTLLSLPGLIIGWGLLRRAEWARIGALILAVLSVFHAPLGTALSVYTWIVLFDRKTIALFHRA